MSFGFIWVFDASNFDVVDSKTSDTAELFERVSQSIKVKHYSEALNDLNAAIEADPTLSEAYFRRGSVLRQLCRLFSSENLFPFFLSIFSSLMIFISNKKFVN